MTKAIGLVRAHPVAAYFALTFAISWGAVLLIIGGPGSIPGSNAQTNPLFPFVYLAMLAGPSVAGVVMTLLVDGQHGLRQFAMRLLRWRAAPRFYLIALVSAPVLVGVALILLSSFSREYRPELLVTDEAIGLVSFGLVIGLRAGFFEELGWTGFAIPRLRQRHSVFMSGLILGVVWGLWHTLVVAWGIGVAAGTVPLAIFLPLDLLSFLPAYRVLMTWVYDRTESLFLSIVMHASLTASMLILESRQLTGVPLLTYLLVISMAVWLLVAMAISTSPRRLAD
jgi:uncharacterized protein